MDKEEKIKLYIKAYEEGQKEAWSDIDSLASKHQGRELKMRIESRIGTLYQDVEAKREELKEHPEKLSLERKEPPDDDGRVDIPWNIGQSYLFLDDDPKRAVKELVDIVKDGISALFILRDPPDKILKRYDVSFKDCEYVILSKQSRDVGSINDIEVGRNSPDDLQGLSSIIGKFLKSKENPVVLLCGISFLTNYNKEEKVMKLLYFTKEKVTENDGCLAASLPSDAVGDTFLEKFKSEFDEIY